MPKRRHWIHPFGHQHCRVSKNILRLYKHISPGHFLFDEPYHVVIREHSWLLPIRKTRGKAPRKIWKATRIHPPAEKLFYNSPNIFQDGCPPYLKIKGYAVKEPKSAGVMNLCPLCGSYSMERPFLEMPTRT